IVVAYALGGRRFSHPPKPRCSVELHFSLLRDTAGIACPQLGLARRHYAPAHFERLRRDQRAHTPVGKTLYACFGYRPAEGTQVQGCDQRAVHHQARVALGLGDVGPVVMNAVAIEGDRRIAEQQRRSGLDPLAPVAFRHWITAGELWRGRLAVDDVLLLTDGQPAVLQVVMTQGYEQQRTRAADLFLDIENGGGASGFAAYLQRLVELQTSARPHAIAIAGRRQETTPRRMTVFAKAGLGDRVLKKAPLPQRRQRFAMARIRLAEGCGDTLNQVAAQLIVNILGAPDPGGQSRVGHRSGPRCVVFLQDAMKPAFREFVFTDTGVRLC